MQLLSPAEIAEVMTIPPEARHYAWVRLIAENRVTIDMIRDAEGLEDVSSTVTDDPYSELPGGDYGSAVWKARPEDYNPDLTGGVILWSYRFGQAMAWVLLALGAVTLIQIVGRRLGFTRKAA